MTNLKEQARAFSAEHKYYEFWQKVAYSGYPHATEKLAELMADFAEQQLAEKEKEVERLRTALVKLIEVIGPYRMLQNPDSDEEQMLADALEEALNVVNPRT